MAARRGSLGSILPDNPLTRSSSRGGGDSPLSATLLDSDDDGGAAAGGEGGPRRGSWTAVGSSLADVDAETVLRQAGWTATGVSVETLRLRAGAGIPVTINDRLLALFEHRNAIYAVDGMCYHAGGPLAQADLVEIEELDNRPCVVCPWHHYMIMLDSGEGVYRHVEPGAAGGAAAAAALRDSGAASANSTIKSKGRKQRIHPVRVVAGLVEVALSSADGPLHDATQFASDYYASDTYKQIMARSGSRTKAPASASIVAASLESF